MLESGGEKTQPVPQKQRKNACMAVLLLTIVIAVGGCVGEMGFDGIIGGGHMINNAYAEESVLLVTNETAKLLASDGANNDYFGWSVSVYNNTAVIGAVPDDGSGSDSGFAYVFEYSSGTWSQKEKLNPDDGSEDAYFGYSVSVSDRVTVIGAYGDDSVDADGVSIRNSGSAYVFERNENDTWTQKAKLVADDATTNDRFGRSVSVYNNTAVIGALFDDDNGSNSGSAYVFEYSSGTWTQKQKLTASDAAADDYFGRSVSVYNNTAVIGAVLDDGSVTNSGSAYVFEKNSSGTWTQKQKLLPSDTAADNYFGRSVSVYNNTAVIGAVPDDGSGSYSGFAYVFEYSSGNWTEKQKLTASDAAAGDYFGWSVSVYNNTAVIGALFDDGSGSNSGSAYVFEYSSGNWTEKQKLTASDGAEDDYFGWSVSLYNNTAVIGAFYDDDNGSNSGSAYVFTISANQAPTAHAGGDQTVNEGTTDIQLNGSATDPDTDDTITYLWSQTQGPTVTLSSSTSASTTFDAPLINSTQAILTFSLTVNDGAVDSTPDTVDITVSNVNTPPTAHAGGDQTVNEGTTDIQLNGSATDPDTDDTITYLWSQTQGPTVTLSSSTSASTTFDAPLINSTQAILTFSLTVNDGAVDSTPDTVDITVSNVNTPPTAHAGGDQTVNEGTTDIQLNGSATDPDTDDTITYLWSQTQGPTVTLSSSTSASTTFDAPLINSTQAILTFSLTVNDGAVDSTPDTVDITVSNVNTPPTAHAGGDQTVNEGTTDIQLNGTGSADPDGDTITYLWSQTQGPTVTLSSSTSASTTFDAPLINSTQAILTFSLTVNDGAVDSTPDTVDITVSNVNTPPTAHAGGDQTVNEGTTDIQLNGSATDPDTDDTITYLWSQTQGPTVTLSSSTSASTTFDAPLINSTQAILTFSLTVNDGAVDSTPDTVDITVSNVNTPPTAHAGGDQTVNEGTTDIQLNGTGSADPDGDTITYLWSQTQGPTVTLSSSTSASTTFDAPLINSTQAILTFSLTVNDGAVDSTPDTVDITVSNVNTPPTAHAGGDQTVNEGTTDIQLNGSATDPDTDDTITYLWSQTQGPTVTLSSSTSASTTFDAPLINSTQAILTFSLTVNDGAVDSTPDTVDITVSNVNTPPTAHAGGDQTVNEGTTDIQLNGTGSADPDGDTITYLWSQTQGPTVTLSSSTSASTTFDAPLINSTQAILTFSLTVNDGAVDSTPDTVDITVSNVNTPPTAHAGGDQTVNEGTTDIQLNGTGSADPDGDTITYLWSQTQGPTVTLSSSTSASTTFDAPLINSTQAILTFSLTVNDGAVDSTPDTVDITVSNVNTPPTAHAGGDQTVNEGTTDIQLNGTGSADPDGDTITYLWSQTQGPTVTLSSSTSASTTFDAPLINSTQAILTFSLTVNDGAVDSTPDTVDITVSNVNTPPTAHAGGDQTVNEGTTDIQLNGSATDPDTDDTITYLWSQTQGPTVTLSSSTSASTTFDAPLINSTQAILTFSLTVNDGAVDSTPDTVDITVSNVNTPPTAHAGGDQTVNEGTTDIQLNGSATDPDTDDTITYLWSQTQGPTVTLSSSTSASTTFDAPLINSTQAILTFSLTVNDGAVDSTPDTVDITVSNVNTPPTAHAGGDQTVNEGTTDIQLNGSATDPDTDDTITYLWSQTQGPTVTLSSSTSASTTFDAPLINSTQAILTFSLTVNDGAVDSTPDTVDITVSNVNTPPTAHAGGDQTVNEGTTDIQLNGSATDPDTDDTITYLWSQTQGPTVTLSSSTSASTTFDAPLINSTQAILTFSLTVNDGAVDSTPDTVDITVSNVNTPPTAHAGGDQTVNEGTTDIQLNGSATDPDTDDTITYLWSQTQGPTVTLSSSTSASTTFDAPLINSTQAILTFSLTVNDGAVDSTPDTVDITVSNVNTPPTAHAGGDQTVNEGTTDIQLNGSATDPDTDDTITYLWSQTQGPTVTLSSSTSASTTFDAPLINSTQAILTFSLTVNDGAVDSTPDTVDITVSNVNTPPTAHAGGDQTVNEGTTDIQLNGSATDPDTDDTITYLWSQTQGPTVTLSSSTSASTTFDAPLINSTQAILTFSLTVNDGAVDSTPDTVDITVSNVNTPPTAHAGGDQTVNEGTTDIQLNGSATDPDTDDTITYLWSQTQGPTVTLSSSTSASTTFDAPLINSTQAILTFSLTVNDGAVDSTPDTVDITVSNVNTPPTAHAGGDQTVNEGTTDIQLNGSATDPDTDDTITYLWSQTQGPTVTLSSSTSASTTFDAPLINSTQAILTFSLTVNDGAVDSTPDTVDITVSNVNTPPTAHAGGDQTVNEGTTDIQLNGSATDPDTDDTITYLWSQTQGPTVTLSSSTSASTTFDAPLINSTQAILTFSLTVNDGAVDSTPDTVDITVSNVNTPPTAHAGGDQTVNEGTTDIQLNGSATDPDTDDTITYLWSQTQGPTVTLSSSTSASTTFDAPLINSTQAILTFSLTVNDGAVDSTPDTVDITVSNVNTPPTAHAGGDQTVNEGTTDIQLNGSATDPDTDDTITYLWSQTQGPTVTLSSSTSASTTFDAPLINSTQAILTFSLTVNDGAVDSTPDTVDITVSNVNTPPTAHAGGDQTVNEGTTDIQLNGSATDPDTDDTITYLWSQTQGPTVTLSSSTSASTTFDAPLINSTQAILTFSLTVNDGAVDSTPDTVDITVSNVNTPPTAHAGGDQTVNEGTTDIQLNGSATDPDTDDTITYLWSQTQGPTVTLSSSTSASTTFDAPLINSTQAILTFSLTVNDGAVDSTPDTVDITVSNVNTPPTAHAGGDQTVNEGTTDIQLNGSATDPDTDDTITYLWSQTQGPTVTLSSSTSASTTFDAPLINSTQAILTFSLTVNDGAVDSTPDTVDITVSNVNTPPTAHAGGDQTVNEGTTDIQLNGSATDPDTDDTITYLWSQTQGPTVTLSSSTSASTTFDAPLINSTQAILTFSLTVNDGAVDSTPDTVDITVSNVNTPPTAHAGGDQTVNEGTTDIQLNGSATDPDTDDTITYLWSQTQGPTVTLSSSTSASTTFDAPLINSTQAILTFSLTVNDGAVDSTPDTVDITVSNVNTPPTAHAGGDQTVNEGTTDIQLNGSATDPDTDDTITYLWSQTQGPTVTLSSSTSASTTFDAPLINSTQAILTFSLTVNDGAVDSTPDTVDITVSNVNTPPTAHAGGDQTVNEGTTDIQLNGSATDPDTDDTITYLWSQTQGPTVTLSSSTSASTTFDAPLINSTQAILTFSLTVNDGAVDSTPDTVDITVSNVNTPPTAHAGGDQTVNEGTTDIQLNGSATDPDTDDTITYLWSQTQGPTVTLFSSTSESPRFTTPTVTSEQTLIFSLVVNDGTVDSTPDTVDITIQDTINESPTAHAGDDQTVSEGTTDIQLNGTGSADPNGDAITYAWSQNEDNAFEVTLSSSTSESPRFTTPTVTSDQTLTFSLTVNDGAVDSTPDTVDITVLDTDDVLLTSPGSPSGSSGSSSSGSSSGIGTSGGGGGGGSGSSSGIGISGGGGGSGSSSGIGISGGGGGRGSSTWVDDIYLKSVSWDCNAGTIKIIVGPDSDYISVAVRTTQLGIHQASIAGDDIPGYRAFVSPMHKTEDYINIKAVALSGRNLVAISESIDVDACVGERTYHTPDDSTTTTIKQPVPKQEDDKDRLADFVDPKKNPQYYIDRYNNEIEYREWFDENYPGITIYEAVGLPVPDPTLEPAVEQEPAVDPEPAMKQEPEPICDPRAELVDGFCIPVTPRPEENGGGCLIATAAYGTELAPQVQLLREIRDNTVLQTQSGSAFMDSFNSFYYSFSPSIADLERQNPVFREAVKMAVTPLISSLAILDYVDIDSESEMLGYGIGIVAMNIAMYVALPVSALYYVRRLVA